MSTPHAVISKATNYTIQATDYLVIATAVITVTLPSAVGKLGATYVIKNGGVVGVTVATTSGQTIDGKTTTTVAPTWSTLSVISDGANWFSL